MERLSDAEIERRLETLDGWTVDGGRLHREFRFKTFREAFGFMTAAAIHAEKINHHPAWTNVYNRVVVDLSTHDASGLTDLDFTFASELGRLYGRFGGTP